MKTGEKKQKITKGDLVVVGKMLGITRTNAKMALMRIGSKRHEAAKQALAKVIANREALINESKEKL